MVSPSHGKSDAGEGQLRPITSSGEASPAAQSVSATPAPKQSQPQAAARVYHAETPKAPAAAKPMTAAGGMASRPRGPMGGLRVPDLSLKGIKKQDESKVAEDAPVYQRRNQEFTDVQFADAWKDIMEKHPSEHLMINAMRISNPKRSTATEFVAVVESEAIRDILVASTQLIVGELRKRLSNDFVTLDVELNKGKTTVTSLTDAEVFQVMRKNNPYFNEFIDDFHLTLL